MLDTLVAIALAICWIVGFFVSAQFLHHQFQIARKLDEMRKQENVKAQMANLNFGFWILFEIWILEFGF